MEVFIPITGEVRDIVRASGVRDGVVYVITAHTTTGIAVNESLECLESDLQEMLCRLVPDNGTYAHARFLHSYGAMASNATSHQKAHLTGSHCVFPVSAGEVVLGHAQDIYLCEFDGPQRRTVNVTVMGE
jgi:secondary thiamine-phosphate synthase enzyme